MTEETKIYGQTASEKLSQDSKVAREIVREIGHFGVNDRQRWLIIYNLALELENIDEMKEVTAFIKEIKGNDLFITKIYGAEDNDGTPSQ